MSAAGTPDDDWHPHVFRMPDWVEAFVGACCQHPALHSPAPSLSDFCACADLSLPLQLIVTILFTSMFLTRTKNYSIFGSNQSYSPITASPAAGSPRTSIDSDPIATYRSDYPTKTRRVFGIWTVRTPNSSRFARHFHSRILQKFPFLVEMFYWVLQFFFYRMTAHLASVYYGGKDNMWETAQNHGIALLELEAAMFGRNSLTGTAKWVEWSVQQWFLTGARAGDFRGIFLTILNRSYSLIHIPGTVGYVSICFFGSVCCSSDKRHVCMHGRVQSFLGML